MVETVYFELTTACPCSCKICHIPEFLRHGQPITRSTPDITLDLMILKERLSVENLVVSGGEPTLHPNLEEIITFAKKLGMNVAVISNCVKPETLKALSDKAKIWVSIDYYGEKQDEWRGFKGLWRNYQSIADIANIRATLLKDNLEDVKKLIAEAASRGKEITIVPLKGASQKLAPTPKQLQQLLLYIFKQGYAKQAVIDAPSVRMFLLSKHPQLRAEAEKNGSLCAACQTIIRVNPEGYVKPCPFLDHTICRITDPEIKEKIAQTRQEILKTYTGKCKNCKYREICGGCRASQNTECFLN